MAKLSMNYFSNALRRNIDINVILPIDSFDYGSGEYLSSRKFKTIYLLHGIFGCNTDWLNNTNLMTYLTNHQIAVVLPSGENSFYVDNIDTGAMYSKFIGEELPNITRKTFPLSENYEDTYIAGLSMGGFGALLNGIRYHETFSVIGAFSSAIPNELASQDLFPKENFGLNFKRLLQVSQGQFDLIEQVKNKKSVLPYIYMTCGTEDFLYDKSQSFVESLKQLNIDHEYHEWSGEHDWVFWDQSISKFLEFITNRI